MTKEERHFIYMCGISGQIFGAQFTPDKKNGETVKSKYNDPVYQKGYTTIIEDRLWRTRTR